MVDGSYEFVVDHGQLEDGNSMALDKGDGECWPSVTPAADGRHESSLACDQLAIETRMCLILEVESARRVLLMR